MGYCLPVVPCTSLTFKCSSKVCIGKENPECDGIVDCSNGFDERNCGEYCTTAAQPYSTLPRLPSATHQTSWAVSGPTLYSGGLGQPLVVHVLLGPPEPTTR